MNPKAVLRNAIKKALKPVSVTLPSRINGQAFKVPVVGGVGASNLGISEYWMIDLWRRAFALHPKSPVLDVGANLGQTLLKQGVKTGNQVHSL